MTVNLWSSLSLILQRDGETREHVKARVSETLTSQVGGRFCDRHIWKQSWRSVAAFTHRHQSTRQRAASWRLNRFYSSVASPKEAETLSQLRRPAFAACVPKGFLLGVISFGPFCYSEPQLCSSTHSCQPLVAAWNCSREKWAVPENQVRWGSEGARSGNAFPGPSDANCPPYTVLFLLLSYKLPSPFG